MSLRIKSRKVDKVVVFDIEGRLTCGEPQLLLRDTVRRFIDDGNDRFVLNLSEVSYVDSSGLGELVSIKSLLNKIGGRVSLLGVAKKVQNLLVMTNLVIVFDSFAEESEALAALHVDRNATPSV
jgi:anti-sigma B factor antagonist